MLKVLRSPPNVMGEHTPLHACACLDHACRVCLIFRGNLLVCLGIHHLPVLDSTPLHLLKEGGAVKTHIGARWSFDRAVVEVIPGDGTASSSHSVTQSMWDGAFLREVSPHRAILAPT